MTWKKLAAANRIRPHKTSPQELSDLRAVVARDLQDAKIAELSDDRRFAIAYNAALQLAKMVIACAGYRVVGQGHHQTSFECLVIAMGKNAANEAAYFETCRRLRNQVDYDLAEIISQREADELVDRAAEFGIRVEAWISKERPDLLP